MSFSHQSSVFFAMPDNKSYIPPILIALIFAILPNIPRLPVWIILWCLCAWGYIVFSIKYLWPWPGRMVRFALAAAGVVGLLMTYPSRIDSNACLGLMAIMSALKPFEIFTHRDRMVTIFLAYFMIIASLFQSNSLFITIYMFLTVVITTAALIRINDPSGNLKAGLRLSMIIVAQAIPLMILLFFLFPRIQGGLFSLSRAAIAESGFSDELSFGSVSQLVVNDDVAFRAEFAGAVPAFKYLYWRGIVFDVFNGKKWRRSHNTVALKQPPSGEAPVNYTVILEPTGSRWLFALDLPGKPPKGVTLNSDYTLSTQNQVTKTFAYSMTSYPRYQESNASQWMLQEDLQLPSFGNPKSHALAHKLTADAAGVEEKISQILSYFKKNGFVYTLKPPMLGADSIDDFLFESKRGYCQHYAVAFAFLMRAAGVPARIVGGYLGGEINPFGNYLIVRQSDAHVWVEVWEPENGWVRVDPTATVAPGRITGRPEGILPADELSSDLWLRYLRPFSKYIKIAGFEWDALATAWNMLIYSYSYYEQRLLFEKIGIKLGSFIGSILAFALVLFLTLGLVAGYAFFDFNKAHRQKDSVKRHYQKFCDKMAAIGITKRPDQGAIHFAEQAAFVRPDLKQGIDRITHLYVQLRYRPKKNNDTLKQFITAVRCFKPGKMK